MVVFIAVTWFIANIGRKESEDEYISGMQLTDKPAEVNKLLRKNGEFSDLRVGDLHMVRMAEVLNFLMHGTIGVGKSTLIRWLLDYIRKRGDGPSSTTPAVPSQKPTTTRPPISFLMPTTSAVPTGRCGGSVSTRSITTTWPPASFRWKVRSVLGIQLANHLCRPRHSYVDGPGTQH
jgi:hypothetical protein